MVKTRPTVSASAQNLTEKVSLLRIASSLWVVVIEEAQLTVRCHQGASNQLQSEACITCNRGNNTSHSVAVPLRNQLRTKSLWNRRHHHKCVNRIKPITLSAAKSVNPVDSLNLERIRVKRSMHWMAFYATKCKDQVASCPWKRKLVATLQKV